MNAAFAGNAGHVLVWKRELDAHRCRQAESHGAEPAGVYPPTRFVEGIELRRKHLMLADVRGNVGLAFGLSMAAWLYVIWYIMMGEASKINANLANPHVQKAYKTMTLLVTVGWAIYPLGYFLGYLGGGADPGTMNVIYNLADFWNKIAFGVVIWSAAVADTDESNG